MKLLINLPRPFICLMVGLRGSGKSTVVDALEVDDEVHVVSLDDIRLAIANRKYIPISATYHGITSRQVYEVYNKFKAKLISQNKSFIIDASNLTSKQRIDNLSEVPDNYHKAAIIVDEEISICRSRSLNNGNLTGEQFMSELAKYTIPSYDEGFNSIFMVNSYD